MLHWPLLAVLLLCHCAGRCCGAETDDVRALVQSLAADLSELRRQHSALEAAHNDTRRELDQLRKWCLPRNTAHPTPFTNDAEAATSVPSELPTRNGGNSALREEEIMKRTADAKPRRSMALLEALAAGNAGPGNARALSLDSSCTEAGNTKLLVEGAGTFADDIVVGSQQTSFLEVADVATDAAQMVQNMFNWMCLPSSTREFTKAVQTIDRIGGPNSVSAFEIDKEVFLALPSMCKRSYSNCDLESAIYKFNDVTEQFEPFQTVSESGAYYWEHFNINGTDFLAVAKYFDGSYETNSTILRFNITTEQFEFFQYIETKGAMDWEHFTINGEHFIAGAFYRTSTYRLKSVVYRFNETQQTFDLFQQIDTLGCGRWEHFEIGTSHFLAGAYYHSGGTLELQSQIFRFNSTARQFELFQAIPTTGASDCEYFRIGDASFLAYASFYSDTTATNTTSEIRRFNETTNRFESFQNVSTIGASDWEYFDIGDSHFLAVVNNFGAQSVIYRFNDATAQFEQVAHIDTPNPRRVGHFTVGDVDYLAIADWEWNTNDGTLYIYQCNALCFS